MLTDWLLLERARLLVSEILEQFVEHFARA